jgi:hypothetical protein
MKTDVTLLGQHVSIASRRRRRLLVTLLYAAAALVIAASLLLVKPAWPLIVLCAFAFMARFLGGRNEEGGILPPVDRGDERESHRRDHAYFLAYWWWDITLLPAILSSGFRINGIPAAWNPELRALLYQLPVALLVASGILYYTLPQAILLWTEPDMEAAESR